MPFTPIFPILIKQGAKEKTVDAGLDSGLKSFHLKLPSSIADELGIKATGVSSGRDMLTREILKVGKADWLSIPDTNCKLANPVVLIGGEDILVGNVFLANVGAEISYVGERVSLACRGKGVTVGFYPEFAITLKNKGKTFSRTAVFDTGFEGYISLPAKEEKELALERLGTQTVQAHTGSAEMVVSKLDGIELKDRPKCGVTDPQAILDKPNGPLDKIYLGEAFMRDVKGTLGYDGEGAYFFCQADPKKVRATQYNYLVVVPPEYLPYNAPPSLLVTPPGTAWIPWAIAGSVVGIGIYFLMQR